MNLDISDLGLPYPSSSRNILLPVSFLWWWSVLWVYRLSTYPEIELIGSPRVLCELGSPITGTPYIHFYRSLLAGAATNFSGRTHRRKKKLMLNLCLTEIFAIRFFLGIFESPMLPGVVFYLSTFYKRGELASRVGIFYGTCTSCFLWKHDLNKFPAAASISGAFSGVQNPCCFNIVSPLTISCDMNS